MTVRISAEARADLLHIGVYIARDNPARAVTFVRELRQRCLSLSEAPRAFPLLPGYEVDEVRRCIHGNYHILYRERLDLVFVLRVLHGAMDYEMRLLP